MSEKPTKKVWINGLSGKMGLELQTLIARTQRWHLSGGSGEAELVDRDSNIQESTWAGLSASLSRVDMLIDFSAPAANSELYEVFEHSSIRDKAVLIGTTGLTAKQIAAWNQLASSRNLRLLQAPNTSLGVLLTLKISQQIARVLDPLNFDIEVLETHHRAKIDAPSGTANFLADSVAASVDKRTIYGRTGQRQPNEVGVSSLRGGSVFGEHEIRFLGDHEEIVVSHRALSRKLFAQGALMLADWVIHKPAGSWTLHDISIEDMLSMLDKK